MSKRLTDDQVVQTALAMQETTTPTTDLICALRRKYGVSDVVAGRAYSRVIMAGLINQRSRSEGKSPAVATLLWRWVAEEREAA